MSWFVRIGDHVWVVVDAAGQAEADVAAEDPENWLEMFQTKMTKKLTPADADLLATMARKGPPGPTGAPESSGQEIRG